MNAKQKHISNQNILKFGEPYENLSNTNVSLVIVPYPNSLEPGVSEESESSCSSTSRLIDYGPPQQGEFRRDFQGIKWKDYGDDNSRVFIQGKDFIKPYILCLVCKKFCRESGVLQRLLPGETLRVRNYENEAPEHEARDHHLTKKELQLSVSKGCHMCTLILYGIEYGIWAEPTHNLKFQFQTWFATSKVMLKLGDNTFGSFNLYPLLNENSQRRSCPN
jgi:hypothetical protein